MGERVIREADLSRIDKDLRAINENIGELEGNLNRVDNKINTIDDAIQQLTDEFRVYVGYQICQNRLGQAKTEIVKIRQEISTKYGHYDEIRRKTIGILKSVDIGIIRKDTIHTATENALLIAPNYWLSPCLVALSSWISDKKTLADKAVKKAIELDNEKTSLLFTLICTRANRKSSALIWMRCYLDEQSAENINRKTMLLIDAFSNGLLGVDSEHIIVNHMNKWIEELSAKGGFLERQRKQWSKAIELKKKDIKNDTDYIYLKKYSKTWTVMKDVLKGALLHHIIYEYFYNIFNQQIYLQQLIDELDKTLEKLVKNYDDEELPLREEEAFEQAVIDCDGDEEAAQKKIDLEKEVFKESGEFTQILTNAAMNPELSHASISTQKIAIALSKDWIIDAYNDIIAKNRKQVPYKIKIDINNFHGYTVDGRNEKELIEKYDQHITQEKQNLLSQAIMTGFQKKCLYPGFIIALFGLWILFTGSTIMGVLFSFLGLFFIVKHFSSKDKVIKMRQGIETEFEEKRTKGKQIILAILAEVYDYREEFANKDRESYKVIDFLEKLTPEQYIQRIVGSSRRIRV